MFVYCQEFLLFSYLITLKKYIIFLLCPNTACHFNVKWLTVKDVWMQTSISMTLLQYTSILIRLKNHLMRASKPVSHFWEVSPRVDVPNAKFSFAIFRFLHNSWGRENAALDIWSPLHVLKQTVLESLATEPASILIFKGAAWYVWSAGPARGPDLVRALTTVRLRGVQVAPWPAEASFCCRCSIKVFCCVVHLWTRSSFSVRSPIRREEPASD